MHRLRLAVLCLALGCGSSAPSHPFVEDGVPEEVPGAASRAPDAAPRPVADAAVTPDLAAPDTAIAVSPDAAPAGWPAVTDYGARGPYPIARDSNTGPGGAFDVFRP